jgi:hypothetical protein
VFALTQFDRSGKLLVAKLYSRGVLELLHRKFQGLSWEPFQNSLIICTLCGRMYSQAIGQCQTCLGGEVKFQFGANSNVAELLTLQNLVGISALNDKFSVQFD